MGQKVRVKLKIDPVYSGMNKYGEWWPNGVWVDVDQEGLDIDIYEDKDFEIDGSDEFIVTEQTPAEPEPEEKGSK